MEINKKKKMKEQLKVMLIAMLEISAFQLHLECAELSLSNVQIN